MSPPNVEPLGRLQKDISDVHTEKALQNLIKSNRNQILFTIFRLFLNKMDVRLDSLADIDVFISKEFMPVLCFTNFFFHQVYEGNFGSINRF